jgi:hypothetical protein
MDFSHHGAFRTEKPAFGLVEVVVSEFRAHEDFRRTLRKRLHVAVIPDFEKFSASVPAALL